MISGVNRITYRVFRSSGFLFRIGRDNIFREIPHNPSLATKRALKRAMEIVGVNQPIIRIFGDTPLSSRSVLSYDI